MKVSFVQILFRARSALGALWVLLLLVFSDPWISTWSALIFVPGLALRFWAAGFIGPVSRSPKITSDRLVTRGPYSLFRHPLYIGNALLVAAGLLFLRPHWILILATGLGFLTLYVLLGIAEEKKLIEKYRIVYDEYRKRVTPFFPVRYVGPLFKGFNSSWAFREWQTLLVVGILWGFAYLRTLVPRIIESVRAM